MGSEPNEMDRYNSLAELMHDLVAHKASCSEKKEKFLTYLAHKAWKKAIPIKGTFELTPLCNFDCKMCYVHLHADQLQGRNLLSTDTWIHLIDQACESGMMEATLTGGECLTYPGFSEIYLYLISRGIGVSILSNGSLINDEMIQFFSQYAPRAIQISLYGSNNDTYEQVTGRRVFTAVMEVIRKIQKAGLNLNVTITPNKYMMDDIEILLNLVESMNIQYTVNSSLIYARKETGRNREDYNISVEDYVSIRKRLAKLKGVTLSQVCEENLPMRSIDGLPEYGIKCLAGRGSFSIDWTGKMFACTSLPDIFADALSIGFLSAWTEINAQAKNYLLPIECGQCAYARICSFCIASHRQDAEQGHCSPRLCDFTKRMCVEGLFILS